MYINQPSVCSLDFNQITEVHINLKNNKHKDINLFFCCSCCGCGCCCTPECAGFAGDQMRLHVLHVCNIFAALYRLWFHGDGSD